MLEATAETVGEKETKQKDRRLAQIQAILDHPNSGNEIDRAKKRTLHFNLEHLHGPEEISREPEELSVTCVVRDGRPFVRSFVEHYFSLGAKHIVFVDNGSSDGTVEVLKGYDGVTVFRSRLPHTEYQLVTKQYLVERFGRDRWTLHADVDELFDYPYSDRVSMDSFLGYLSRESYTAVAAQMLDMFPEKPLSEKSTPDSTDELLGERHRFYDISNVEAREYGPHTLDDENTNVSSNPDVRFYTGGIKKTIFGYPAVLTKHPLLFLDDDIEPFYGSAHWANGARVADLTCVLFHYTFSEFLYERVRRDVRQKNYFSAYKFDRLASVLDENPRLQIKAETARELKSTNELIVNGFLVVSEKYRKWVEDERS